MTLEDVQSLCDRLRREVGKVIIGQSSAVDLLIVSLLCGGHTLLEGVPGVAKTLLARTFSSALDLKFGRIQFTPDLMPGDVIGTNLFNFQTNEFALTKGPIFTEILMADEINRTPPKTQAALLQAMQEREVSIDGTTHSLGDGFMVIATQNPIEQQGTYPLPEAQLDRFLFKHLIEYPDRDEELRILRSRGGGGMLSGGDVSVSPVAGKDAIREARELVGGLRLVDEIAGYIVDIVRATREHPAIEFGASPRSADMYAAAARAYAAINGRDFVIPDDVKALSLPILRHRIILAPGAEIEGQSADAVITRMIGEIEAPR